MSEAFKELMEKREQAIKSSRGSGNGLWLVLLLIAGVAVAYVLLRKDPLTGPVNPNTASAEMLATLPGVGPEMAKKILQARKQQPFTKVEDLLKVPGIGEKTLEKMRARLVVEE
jgi:competence ComEA-like helix-hairpin-helix protein